VVQFAEFRAFTLSMIFLYLTLLAFEYVNINIINQKH
jgi:hypothetical protein